MIDVPDLKLDESRFDLGKDPASGIPGMPPNLGQLAIRHPFTFQGIAGSQSKVYRASDEAIRDSFDNAKFMRNDTAVMECVEMRQRAVCLLDWSIEPENAKDSAQVEAADILTKVLKKIPRFMQYRENLLHATWYGKYGIQHRWGYRWVANKMRPMPLRWLPVNGDKIVFRYDDGMGDHRPDQIGIRVGAGIYSAPEMRQTLQDSYRRRGFRGKIESTDHGLAYFFDTWERLLLAVHKYRIEDGEYHDPSNAGRIHGLGVRSVLYWTWFQKQETLANLMEFLERSASGIELWYYPMGNADGEAKMRKAAEEKISNGRNVVLIPRPAGEDGGQYGVEHIEPGMAGAEQLKSIVTDYFGHAIKRYILGQTLTTEASATGLGSNLADIHMDTFMQIVRYDAMLLEETIETDLLDPIKKMTFPSLANVDFKFVIQTRESDAEAMLQAMQMAYDMGLTLDAQQLRDLIGAPKPEDDAEILSKLEQMKAEQEAQAPGPEGAMGPLPGQFDIPAQEEQAPAPDPTSSAPAEATEQAEYVANGNASENSDRARLVASNAPRSQAETYALRGGADPFYSGAARSTSAHYSRSAKFTEADHPRDAKGRFTDSDSTGKETKLQDLFEGRKLFGSIVGVAKQIAERTGRDPQGKLDLFDAYEIVEQTGHGDIDPDEFFEEGMGLIEFASKLRQEVLKGDASQRYETARSKIGDSSVVLFQDPGDDTSLLLLLHPSVRNPDAPGGSSADRGDWQLTTLAQRSGKRPLSLSHTTFDDKEEAIRSALGDPTIDSPSRGTRRHQVAWHSSSGQVAPFSQATWQQVLRYSAEAYKRKYAPRQQMIAWEEEKHPRDAEGKFSTVAEQSNTPKQESAEAKIERAARDYKEHGWKSAAFKAWFGDWENDPEKASQVVDSDGKPQEQHSLVVDDQGRPLKVFHGTGKGGFKVFDKAKSEKASGLLYGNGFYFTENRKIADEYAKGGRNVRREFNGDKQGLIEAVREQIKWTEQNTTDLKYGKVKELLQNALDRLESGEQIDWYNDHNNEHYQVITNWLNYQDLDRLYPVNKNEETKEVYLNIRKPFDIDTPVAAEDAASLRDAFVAAVAEMPDHRRPDDSALKTARDVIGYGSPGAHTYTAMHAVIGKEKTNAILQDVGFDGITHIGGRIIGSVEHRVWIAFEPNQIKETDNRGTFDPNEDRIDYGADPDRYAKFNESLHPRDDDGKFTDGGAVDNSGKGIRKRTKAAEARGELTMRKVNDGTNAFRGKGGISSEARFHRFEPAFRDSETGEVAQPMTDLGKGQLVPSGVHLFDGLPDAFVTDRDGEGMPISLKSSVEEGFVRDGQFYTRQEAADARKSELAKKSGADFDSIKDLETHLRSVHRDEIDILHLFEHEKAIKLDHIRLQPGARGKGTGSKIVRAVQEYAQKVDKPIVLEASPEPRKKKALMDFYRSHGFRKPARSRDYSLPLHSHIWRPRFGMTENYSAASDRVLYAADAWKEEDHPRDADGQFTLAGWDKLPDRKESLPGQRSMFDDLDVHEVHDARAFIRSRKEFTAAQKKATTWLNGLKHWKDKIEWFVLQTSAGENLLLARKTNSKHGAMAVIPPNGDPYDSHWQEDWSGWPAPPLSLSEFRQQGTPQQQNQGDDAPPVLPGQQKTMFQRVSEVIRYHTGGLKYNADFESKHHRDSIGRFASIGATNMPKPIDGLRELAAAGDMRGSQRLVEDTGEFEVVGWRLIEGEAKAGDVLQPSRIHEQNEESGEWEPTDRFHAGVSTFASWEAMREYAKYSDKGFTLALVAGEEGELPEDDPGLGEEVVINEAVVLYTWTRDSSKTSWQSE